MSAAPNSEGLVFSTEKLELPDSTEGVLSILRDILAKPFIQKVQMEVGGHIDVQWYKDPNDKLVDNSPERIEDALSRIELINSEHEGSPQEVIFNSLLDLSLDGYVNSHIFCGSLPLLKKWVGISRATKLPRLAENSYLFLGASLQQTPYVPADSMILCGTNVMTSKVADIVYGARILMEYSDGT